MSASILLSQSSLSGSGSGPDAVETCSEDDLVLYQAIISQLPQAVFVLDEGFRVIWAHENAAKLLNLSEGVSGLLGKHFYRDLFSDAQLICPDYYPLTLARDKGRPARSIMRLSGPRFFELHAGRITSLPENHRLVVSVQDITSTYLPLERLKAIHEAGERLPEFPTNLLLQSSPEQRKEFLKQRVLNYLKKVLHFETFEIRLIDSETKRLVPFISDGMSSEAANRELYVGLEGQGITGYAAATGASYICEDTAIDTLYLKGAERSRSSLTVPLVRYDASFRPVVIGTVNIEDSRPRAFSHEDRLFLEIFCRDLVVALNTLELIEAEATVATRDLVMELHGRLALPADKISGKLAELEALLDSDVQKARQVLKELYSLSRELQNEIRAIGAKLPPTEATPAFQSRRVLVVDPDDAICQDAHKYLTQWGCVVETASSGSVALQMVQATAAEGGYDAILAAHMLPDMKGWEFFVELKRVLQKDNIPYIMLTPLLSYDGQHNFVRAHEQGAQHQVGKNLPPPGELSGGSLIVKPLKEILNKIFSAG